MDYNIRNLDQNEPDDYREFVMTATIKIKVRVSPDNEAHQLSERYMRSDMRKMVIFDIAARMDTASKVEAGALYDAEVVWE